MEDFIKLVADLDRSAFLWLNGLHTPWLDPWMWWATHEWFWIPVFLGWLYAVGKGRRWQELVYLFLCLVALLAASDQISSGLMKPFFARLRPSHEPTLAGLVHLVNGYRGGMYGFPSGHATNSFAIATFLYGILGKGRLVGFLLFAWASVFCYTRIYLGVHYPLDIVTGGAIGFLCGHLAFWGATRWRPKFLAR